MKWIPITICCIALSTGCQRANVASSSAGSGPSQLTPQEMAKKKIPILARTLNQQDLDQLYKYMNQYHAEHGRFPKTMSELDELSVSRDMAKVAAAVNSGELVLVGGAGGILAYEKAALEERGNVLTTNGVQVMTADELRPKLGR